MPERKDGRHIIYVDPMGMVAKLANNAVGLLTIPLVREARAMAAAYGMDVRGQKGRQYSISPNDGPTEPILGVLLMVHVLFTAGATSPPHLTSPSRGGEEHEGRPRRATVCNAMGIRAFRINRRGETAETQWLPLTEVKEMAEAARLILG